MVYFKRAEFWHRTGCADEGQWIEGAHTKEKGSHEIVRCELGIFGTPGVPGAEAAAHDAEVCAEARPVPKLGPAGIDERTAPLEIRQNSSTRTGYAAAANT